EGDRQHSHLDGRPQAAGSGHSRDALRAVTPGPRSARRLRFQFSWVGEGGAALAVFHVKPLFADNNGPRPQSADVAAPQIFYPFTMSKTGLASRPGRHQRRDSSNIKALRTIQGVQIWPARLNARPRARPRLPV